MPLVGLNTHISQYLISALKQGSNILIVEVDVNVEHQRTKKKNDNFVFFQQFSYLFVDPCKYSLQFLLEF